MKRNFIQTIVICMILLSPAWCWAESITHNFKNDAGKSIIYSASNTVATTDLVTYTCSGTDTKFYLDLTYGTTIAMCLPKSTSKVVTSPAIERLTRIQLQYYPTALNTNLKIDVSTNGSTWTDKSDDADYTTSGVDLPLEQGDYYVRFRNTSASGVSILQVMYYIEPCHCLKVVSE